MRAIVLAVFLAGCSQILGVDHFQTGSTDAPESTADSPVADSSVADAPTSIDARPDSSPLPDGQVCGDSFVEPPEDCDSGAVDTNACNKDCTTAMCGDGYTNLAHSETCDTAGDSSTCDSDCTTPSCGDGHTNMQFVVSGTGGKAEQCDLGVNNSDIGSCTTKCQLPSCGDGIKQGGEECDQGAANSNTGNCTLACKNAKCGDGFVDAQAGALHEACDPAATPTTCNSDCTISACGDGKVNSQFVVPGTGGKKEQCDNAANNGDNKDCTAHCQTAVCGDGLIDSAGTLGEQCDNAANNANNKDCTATCKNNVCGDGLTDSAGTNIEACDPGTGIGVGGKAAADSAFCDNDCTLIVCGDGHKNVVAGEVCDDFNSSSCGTCSSNCHMTQAGGDCLNGTGCGSGTDCLSNTCDLPTHTCE